MKACSAPVILVAVILFAGVSQLVVSCVNLLSTGVGSVNRTLWR